ncbi:MAG: hypothetical protein M1829_006627 [Trizodia sp. TS-e1964]|nr:MAG: hypothetical protein M1829_006627 [Trizodia sp. TS-e1964]
MEAKALESPVPGTLVAGTTLSASLKPRIEKRGRFKVPFSPCIGWLYAYPASTESHHTTTVKPLGSLTRMGKLQRSLREPGEFMLFQNKAGVMEMIDVTGVEDGNSYCMVHEEGVLKCGLPSPPADYGVAWTEQDTLGAIIGDKIVSRWTTGQKNPGSLLLRFEVDSLKVSERGEIEIRCWRTAEYIPRYKGVHL